MTPRRTRDRLPLILGALGLTEHDAAVQTLIGLFGGVPVDVRERVIGEPAVASRRLKFDSGGEIYLHDGGVVAVILHVAPTPGASEGLDLSDWIRGLDNDSTLDDFKRVFGNTWRFGDHGARYFTVDGGYVRRTTKGYPETLLRVVVTAQDPSLTARPEDEDCETCADLVVRRGSAAAFDLDATIGALARAVEAGLIRESRHWVRLADLTLLHSSGLMELVESQFSCRACGRAICLSLSRDGSPTVIYTSMNAAERRSLGVIPPVEQWGDAERIATAAQALRYLDHQPGSWFLLEKQGVLHLDARFSAGALDGSVLIRLDDSELDDYRRGGREYLTRLARRINDSSPHREGSPYHARDLKRGTDGAKYDEEVSAAITNHTWIAEQRRRADASS